MEKNRPINFEPDLHYCPKCGDEYRSEFEYCGSCEQKLISGKVIIADKAQKRSVTTAIKVEDDSPVILRKGDLISIKYLQNLLAQEGVTAQIVSDIGGCKKGCGGPEVLLQVHNSDLEEALALLALDYQRSTALESHDLGGVDNVFDADAEYVVCPACGHRFEPISSECPDCGLMIA